MSLSKQVEELRNLNSRCMATRNKAIKEFDTEMNKVWERLPNMQNLCQVLIDNGYKECMYGDNDCENRTCFVCPRGDVNCEA